MFSTVMNDNGTKLVCLTAKTILTTANDAATNGETKTFVKIFTAFGTLYMM